MTTPEIYQTVMTCACEVDWNEDVIEWKAKLNVRALLTFIGNLRFRRVRDPGTSLMKRSKKEIFGTGRLGGIVRGLLLDPR